MVDEALALGVARHVFRPGDWVTDAQFTADGTTLVAAARDGTLRSYDLATGAETDLGRTPSPPEALALAPDGELAITGGGGGEVVAWPLHGGNPRLVMAAGGRPITGLRLSPEGRLLLIERESSPPQVVAMDGGATTTLGPRTGLRFAVAAGDWSRVVMMTAANEIAVSPLGEGDPVRVLAHTDKAIAYLAISPRGDTVLVHDGTTIWAMPFAGGVLHEVAHYNDMLKAVVWSADGKMLAIGGQRSEILVVDTATGVVSELHGHSDAIYTLQFSRDGMHLLSASDDSTARIWNLSDHTTAIVLRGHDDDVYKARFSADERSVVTSSLDGSARVWSIAPPSAAIYVEGDQIESMQVDGDQVMVRTQTAYARWDLATGHREQLLSWADEPHSLGYGIPSRDGMP
jgi:WD40 repeat protein